MPEKSRTAALRLNQQRDVKDGFNAAIDLFHKRWTMRILWELRDGPVTFRELQTACSMVSSSVLNVRISELREAQLIEHITGEGYQLSLWGRELLVAMRPLAVWAGQWSKASR
jgi:DNA-binding HxlR family transcriptional regulator